MCVCVHEFLSVNVCVSAHLRARGRQRDRVGGVWAATNRSEWVKMNKRRRFRKTKNREDKQRSFIVGAALNVHERDARF